MDIPFSTWYPAIERRRSRRSFELNRAIDTDALIALEKVCRDFKPFPHARAFPVNRPSKDIFRGVIGSYGKVSGAPAFIAFIGDMRAPSVHEEVGYTGEGVVLEATALGLNTCWVGGFFRRESVASLIEIKDYERVLAVTPVGYAVASESIAERLMTGFGIFHQRLPLAKLIRTLPDGNLPDWAKILLEAARLSPSAVNRQPWEFDVDDNGITVKVRNNNPEFNLSKRLDCGIAMLHIEVAALNLGFHGTWKLLEPPQVGRFVITDKTTPAPVA
jgi:hypothetical protein